MFVAHGGRTLASVADWRALHPKKHWAECRSAQLLARSWSAAGGFPEVVAKALDHADDLRGLTFVLGMAEHRCDVPGAGGRSATDLMVFGCDRTGRKVVLGVEGKVDEGFDLPVGKWLKAGRSVRSPGNRATRLREICAGLHIDRQHPALQAVPIQLLHRTYAVVTTARMANAAVAILVVHSFVPDPATEGSGFREFLDFARLLIDGAQPGPEPGTPWLSGNPDVPLWLTWVSDAGGQLRRRSVSRIVDSRG